MAIGLNAPFGLRPVRQHSGSPWSGEAQMYFVPLGNNEFVTIGDVMALSGSADVNGVPSVAKCAAGATGVGVVVGVHPVNPMSRSKVGTPLALEDKFIPAATTFDHYVMVVDSPDMEFQVQEVFTGTPLAAADIGLNANFVIGVPANTNQLSATVLDNTTEATTATLNLKILGLAQIEGNTYGLGAIWRVKLNNHAFRAGVAGV